MRFEILLPLLLLLLLAARKHVSGASIGDGLLIEGVENSRRVVACDEDAAAQEHQVVEAQPSFAPVEELELEEAPKMMEEEDVEEVPLALTDVAREALPDDALPVAIKEEKCENPEDVMDVKSADFSERVADEELLKALDTVLANNETLEDVAREEGTAMPLPDP